jgi:hypothetical protein
MRGLAKEGRRIEYEETMSNLIRAMRGGMR